MKDKARRKFLTGLGLTLAGAALGGPMVVAAAADLTGQRKAAAKRPGAQRQWAMVIDLRKCEGCVTIDKPPQCSVACTESHFLPKEQQWLRVVKEDDGHGGTFFRPIPCMQCENAPCEKVCPVGATYHNESGVVLVDHRVCIGCRMCMAACPFDARVFNWTEPENPPGATFANYSPEFPVPHRKGTASKCMLCAHQVPMGKLPACASGCPMKAIYLGDLVSDVATNGTEMVQLSAFLTDHHAYRYKNELGTRPRVYYIPGHGEAYGRRARP